MTKADLLTIAGAVHDIGESAEHYVEFEFTPHRQEMQLYVFNKDADGNSDGITDSLSVQKYDAEVRAWLTRWTERIRKERVLHGTH